MEKPNLWIKVQELPEILKNSKALEAIRLFTRFRRYGLPFSGGWAVQLNRWIEIIDLLDPVDRIYNPPLI